MRNDGGLDVLLKLSAQRALCGHVTKSLRAASLQVQGLEIQFRAIFDESATERDRELLSVAVTEIVADIPDGYTVAEEVLSIAPPREMDHLAHLVFLRAEAEAIQEAQ